MQTKHYVTFLFPGSFFAEEETREVADRNAVPENIPAGCFGYQFFSLTSTQTPGGEELRSAPRDYSPFTYFGEVLTLAGDHETLIFNMEANGYERVVRTIRGNFRPLSDEDTVRPAP